MLKTFIPSVEEGVQVRGQLYWTENPNDLSQDMIELELKDVMVCAGWSENGHYYFTFHVKGILIDLPEPMYGYNSLSDFKYDYEEACKYLNVLGCSMSNLNLIYQLGQAHKKIDLQNNAG